MSPGGRGRKRRAREDYGRLWLVVLGILSGCAVTLVLLYRPGLSGTGGVFEGVLPDPPRISGPVPDTVTVVVYNGSGIDGKGREVQRHLEGRSGGVLFVAPQRPQNADRFDYLETVVVSHLHDLAAARAVAGKLGIPDSSIVWSIPLSGEPEADVSIYLGRDLAHQTFMPFNPN